MLLLCLKIFLVRIVDVTLGTTRTMFTVKGKRLIASLIGFFEVLIWFLIVREALQTEDKSILIAISYALGFATGTYIGGFISVFICYLIPILLYIKAYGKPITYWKNLIQLILAIILCIIGVTAGILTIIDDVSG